MERERERVEVNIKSFLVLIALLDPILIVHVLKCFLVRSFGMLEVWVFFLSVFLLASST